MSSPAESHKLNKVQILSHIVIPFLPILDDILEITLMLRSSIFSSWLVLLRFNVLYFLQHYRSDAHQPLIEKCLFYK